jgi:hypothetical protein
MNISATTTSLSQLSSLQATSAVSPVSSTIDSASTQALDSTTGSDQTQFSKMGELMSQLQNLETTDPTKAKQVLTSIASSLTDQANSSSDPHLQALADKFTQAANTGDLSALKPTGGGGAHHHHRAGGPPPATDATDTTDATDAIDATTAATTGAASATSAASKAASYNQTNNPFSQVESIISNALSGVTT